MRRLLFLFLFIAAAPSLRAQGIFNDNAKVCTDQGSVAQTQVRCRLPNTTGLNNTIGVGVNNSNTANAVTVTDDCSQSYTEDKKQQHSGGQDVHIFHFANSASGCREIIVNVASTGTNWIGVVVVEFRGMDTTGATDGISGANTSGASISAGALSPTPASTNDLLFQCAANDNQGWEGGFTAGTSPWQLIAADRSGGFGCQWQLRASSGAFTPSMSDASAGTYVTAAVAWKTSAGTGTGPSANAHVVAAQHNNFVNAANLGGNTSPVYQFPTPSGTGHTLLLMYSGGPCYKISSLTDSNSNTWTQIGAAFSDNVLENCTSTADQSGENQYFIAKNATTGSSLAVTFTLTCPVLCNQQAMAIFYDMVGLDLTNPYCTGSRADNANSSPASTVTTMPSITPCGAPGIVFFLESHATNTALSISTGIFDSAGFTPDHADDTHDQNNGYAHHYNSSTSALSGITMTSGTSDGAGINGFADSVIALQPPPSGPPGPNAGIAGKGGFAGKAGVTR